MIIARRGFLAGLGALLVAAPAIVRVESIMPVRVVDIWGGDGLPDVPAMDWTDIYADALEVLAMQLTENKGFVNGGYGQAICSAYITETGEFRVTEVELLKTELMKRVVWADPEIRRRLGGGRTADEMFPDYLIDGSMRQHSVKTVGLPRGLVGGRLLPEEFS